MKGALPPWTIATNAPGANAKFDQPGGASIDLRFQSAPAPGGAKCHVTDGAELIPYPSHSGLLRRRSEACKG